MRIGVDSYSYHRFFGELRSAELPAEETWTTEDFLNRCIQLGVDGVSLETCYLDLASDRSVDSLRQKLDQAGLDRVLAWGHPEGLAMGHEPSRFADALHAADVAARLDCELLRIVIGTVIHFGGEDEAEVIRRVVPLIDRIVRQADHHGFDVAIETHCDLTVGALSQVVGEIDSPRLGVVFDTANVVRIGEDLIAAAELLAPHVKMAHVKDIDLANSTPGQPGGRWPGVPLGQGDLDLPRTLAILDHAGFDGLTCVEVADTSPHWSEDEIVALSVDWLSANGQPRRIPCPG